MLPVNFSRDGNSGYTSSGMEEGLPGGFRFAFWAILGVYGVAELVITRLPMGPPDPRDRRSLFGLVLVQAIGIPFVAVTTAISTDRFCHLLLNGAGNILGGMLAIAGIGLRLQAKRTLGRFFMARVAILPDHQVIQQGVYRYVRHPGYLGVLLFFLGWPLLVGHTMSLLVLWLPALAAYLYRMHVEERALVEAFGETYRQYQRRTARLLPFLW